MGKRERHSRDGGGPDRFERLFRDHHAAVVAYVRRRAPRDVVDDVVAETFLVAWRRLDRTPEDEEVLPWLLGVARNVIATQGRGARRRDALVLRLRQTGMEPPSPPDPESGVDDPIIRALARLAPKDREALTLIAWDGLAPHEAARVLGEAPGTFRVRLHRARRRLRGLLQARAVPVSPSADRRSLVVEETAHD